MLVFRKEQPVLYENVKKNVHYSNQTNTNTNTSFFNYDNISDSFKESIITKFIKPIETKLNLTFEKLHNLDSKVAKTFIDNSISAINSNLNSIKENIENIKSAEAFEPIADLGVKGFEVKIKFDRGLQLDITPDSTNYDMFFDIIRKYVFNYSEEWPPKIENWSYFKYDTIPRKLCCFYWPLYGYIKALFHDDFRGNVEIIDLFVLTKMRTYCEDFFDLKPKQTVSIQQTKSKKKKKNRGGNPGQGNPGQGNPRQGNPGQSNPGQGNPKQGNPKQGNPGQGNPIQGNPGQGNPGQGNPGQLGYNNKKTIISSSAIGCNVNKLKIAKTALERTKIKVYGGDTTEYLALRNIVTTQIKKFNENELIFIDGKGMSIKDFILSKNPGRTNDYLVTDGVSKQDIKKFCQNFIKPSENDIIIFDPFTNSTFTYNNLRKWFGIKDEIGYIDIKATSGSQKQPKTKPIIIPIDDVCNIIINALKEFKEKYPLPTPMWKLEANELKGIRTRFMKLLSFLFTSMQKMYEDVKIKNVKDFGKNENLGNVKIFYKKLLNSINIEENIEKKKKLIILKDEVEANMKTF